MDLSAPLTSMMPSLDAQALTVLAQSHAALSGVTVAKLARSGSRSGIKLALDRLAASGLVRADRAGAAIMYTLNRDHLLADAVITAVQATPRLVELLRDRIEKWPTPCVHASIFGSVARNEAGPDSDIDILVVRDLNVNPEDPAWQEQLNALEHDVREWTGNTLSWFETTVEALTQAIDREEPVVQSWREDAVHLYGTSLLGLLRRAVPA